MTTTDILRYAFQLRQATTPPNDIFALIITTLASKLVADARRRANIMVN